MECKPRVNLSRPEIWNSGVPLAGFLWPAETPQASLLLQHGFAEYSARYVSQYSNLTGRLNAAGFDVYALDMPGHGASPGVRRQADLGQVIDWHIAARRSIPSDKPLFLFGHSLGGAVTAGSVMRNQTDLGGVVLSAPALIKLPGFLVAGLGRLGHRYPALPLKSLAPNAMTRSQEILDAVNADPLMCRGWMPLGLISTLCASNQDVWSHVNDWQVPTLLVHGSKDKYTSLRDTKRFAAKISSADKTLRIVDGAYHETFNDPDGAVIAQEVVDWLQTRVNGRFGAPS